MEVYARSLVPRLPAAWPEAQFTVFAGRELAAEWRERPWHPGIRLVELPVGAATRVRWTLVEQTLLAAGLARHRIDLVHSLGNTTPLLAPVRTVVTIHGLIFKRHPEAHAKGLMRGLALLVPLGVRRARRIIAVSRATVGDLVGFLGMAEARMDVVPSGPGADPVADPTSEEELRGRFGIAEGPIVLFVLSPSAHRPHKNLERLIDAMGSVDATLVLPGYATALPELAGDAALLFDPLDTGAIAESVGRLVVDSGLRRELAARGRERAAGFSWRTAAERTVASYKRALS